LFLGYLLGAVVMVAGGLVTVFLGVAAERRSLEDIAAPMATRNGPDSAPAEGAARPRPY
jgi:hypothetical protein